MTAQEYGPNIRCNALVLSAVLPPPFKKDNPFIQDTTLDDITVQLNEILEKEELNGLLIEVKPKGAKV